MSKSPIWFTQVTGRVAPKGPVSISPVWLNQVTGRVALRWPVSISPVWLNQAQRGTFPGSPALSLQAIRKWVKWRCVSSQTIPSPHSFDESKVKKKKAQYNRTQLFKMAYGSLTYVNKQQKTGIFLVIQNELCRKVGLVFPIPGVSWRQTVATGRRTPTAVMYVHCPPDTHCSDVCTLSTRHPLQWCMYTVHPTPTAVMYVHCPPDTHCSDVCTLSTRHPLQWCMYTVHPTPAAVMYVHCPPDTHCSDVCSLSTRHPWSIRWGTFETLTIAICWN